MEYEFLFWRIYTCHGCLVARHKASSRLVSLALLATMTLSICWIDGEKCGISVPILENTYLPWLPCSQTQGFIPAGKSCFTGYHDTEYLLDRWGEVWYISSYSGEYIPALAAM